MRITREERVTALYQQLSKRPYQWMTIAEAAKLVERAPGRSFSMDLYRARKAAIADGNDITYCRFDRLDGAYMLSYQPGGRPADDKAAEPLLRVLQQSKGKVVNVGEQGAWLAINGASATDREIGDLVHNASIAAGAFYSLAERLVLRVKADE